MKTIKMNTSTPYEIIIKDGIIDELNEYISKIYSGKNIYIITDQRVADLYLEKVMNSLNSFNVKSVVIEGYEDAKCIAEYTHILEELISMNICRGELIIGLGGGVIGDLAGFVSATLFRGMDYIQIPTTLLSQVDSSIGGKTGIDFLGYKNIVGAFKQPKAVFVDPTLLRTLPKRELLNGYGEMLKHALISSNEMFENVVNGIITEELIYNNICVKKEFVEADEFDNNKRMILNFGHTFGHLYELKMNILHGEAVLAGMITALKIGEKLGVTPKGILDKVIAAYKKLGISIFDLDYQEYTNDLIHDKKYISEKLNLVLLEDIGKPIIKSLECDDLCKL